MRHLSLVLLLACGVVRYAAAHAIEDARRSDAMKHYRAGEELMRAESFEGAAREFKIATEFDPLFVLAHYSLGQAYMALKRYPDATGAYLACRDVIERQALLSQQERNAFERQREDEVKELKDSLERLRAGKIKGNPGMPAELRLEERIRFLEDSRLKGVDKAPRVPAEISLALGSAYFRSGRLQEAEREYVAAIKANSKLGPAHNNLAVIHMMNGRYKEAQEEIRLAEKAGFPVSAQFKDDLKKRDAVAQKP